MPANGSWPAVFWAARGSPVIHNCNLLGITGQSCSLLRTSCKHVPRDPSERARGPDICPRRSAKVLQCGVGITASQPLIDGLDILFWTDLLVKFPSSCTFGYPPPNRPCLASSFGARVGRKDDWPWRTSGTQFTLSFGPFLCCLFRPFG